MPRLTSLFAADRRTTFSAIFAPLVATDASDWAITVRQSLSMEKRY